MKTICERVAAEREEQAVCSSLMEKAVQVAQEMEAQLAQFRCSGERENLGHLERKVKALAQELVREALAQGAQAKADATPPVCPQCRQALTRVSVDQTRHFTTCAGEITVRRKRGYCRKCRQWHVSADQALGLAETAGYSPGVQEMASLLVSKMPVAEASRVLEHLSGVKIPPATLHREVFKQAKRAEALRTQTDQQPTAPPPRQLEMMLEPYQLILQIDAWNIRERDHWGQTRKYRKKGDEPERWHWVYTGTCFRLDHRGQTAGGRPTITERGFVATRGGIDALRTQLHAEARRRGLGQAAGVLIIADGAVWIWRLADDRFPQAHQRLDFYHAVQHLRAIGQALYGEDPRQLEAWLAPLVSQLKNSTAVKVVEQLQTVLASLPEGKTRTAVVTEVNYLRSHQARMDYRRGRRRGEPIGSGAIEATCRQYQCRFKRTGQFWSTAGDEALLCLDTFWRNNRWHLLFPHTLPADPARN